MTSEAAKREGWSTEKPVTEEVKDMCIKMKSDMQKMAEVHFDVFTPETYRSEPQCGGHYLAKVKVREDDKYIHVMVCNVPHGGMTADTCLTVKGVQYPKSASHPLEPFGALTTACGK